MRVPSPRCSRPRTTPSEASAPGVQVDTEAQKDHSLPKALPPSRRRSGMHQGFLTPAPVSTQLPLPPRRGAASHKGRHELPGQEVTL